MLGRATDRWSPPSIPKNPTAVQLGPVRRNRSPYGATGSGSRTQSRSPSRLSFTAHLTHEKRLAGVGGRRPILPTRPAAALVRNLRLIEVGLSRGRRCPLSPGYRGEWKHVPSSRTRRRFIDRGDPPPHRRGRLGI